MIDKIAKVAVVGSSNIDMVVDCPYIPKDGETILGGDFAMFPGGKGANQAVAAAKLGAEVFFVARLGKDVFAQYSMSNFKEVGVNTKYVKQIGDAASGVALIAVEEGGNNAIVVSPGANAKMTRADIDAAENDIINSDVVVSQLEIELDIVEYVAKFAAKHNVPFILDPAPAKPLPDSLIANVDVIKPNETEAEILTGIKVVDKDSACRAAKCLISKGAKSAIITMGAKGSMVVTNNNVEFLEPVNVNAVDTTAAGDAFCGSLAYYLAQGKSLVSAATIANVVAAVSVTTKGAQPSMPNMKEVTEFIKANNISIRY